MARVQVESKLRNVGICSSKEFYHMALRRR